MRKLIKHSVLKSFLSYSKSQDVLEMDNVSAMLKHCLSADAKPYCQANPMEILPMSDNCAHYINCTVYLGGSSMADPVQECQYPDLFSTISMTCQDFTTVVCNTRPEPQAPCKFVC